MQKKTRPNKFILPLPEPNLQMPSNPSELVKIYLKKGFSVIYQELNRFLFKRGFFSKLHRLRFSFKDNQLQHIPTLSDFVNPLYLSAGIFLLLLLLVFPLLDPRKPVQFMGVLGLQMMITAWLVGWLYANEDKLGIWAMELLKNAASNVENIAETIKETIGQPAHAEL
jgi:hypothetical protein